MLPPPLLLLMLGHGGLQRAQNVWRGKAAIDDESRGCSAPPQSLTPQLTICGEEEEKEELKTLPGCLEHTQLLLDQRQAAAVPSFLLLGSVSQPSLCMPTQN